MINATFSKHKLHFKQASGTSRGVLHSKDTYILSLSDGQNIGLGECNLFAGLSYDDRPDYETVLQATCQQITQNPSINFSQLMADLQQYPSVVFGLEQALANLTHGKHLYFPNDFSLNGAGININGLIWMGDIGFMQKQIDQKLAENYKCIKLKIGVNWPQEHQIIKDLRKIYTAQQLEIRVDANGAFSPEQAPKVLQQLQQLQIHSIEQPIKAGQRQAMQSLCANSPCPIALDEELIGITHPQAQAQLLAEIKPQYIILKPALVGGFAASQRWIDLAQTQGIGWWITSALESNIGLNALAQWTYGLQSPMPQGLGTGGLFDNNFDGPLYLKDDFLYCNPCS